MVATPSFWKGWKMANRNKEIKDVVDLRSLKHKKFLSEWGTWVNGTYNVRKKTIDNNVDPYDNASIDHCRQFFARQIHGSVVG